MVYTGNGGGRSVGYTDNGLVIKPQVVRLGFG